MSIAKIFEQAVEEKIVEDQNEYDWNYWVTMAKAYYQVDHLEYNKIVFQDKSAVTSDKSGGVKSLPSRYSFTTSLDMANDVIIPSLDNKSLKNVLVDSPHLITPSLATDPRNESVKKILETYINTKTQR